MSESTAKPKRRKLVKPGELIIAIVFIAAIVLLSITLVNKLTLRHDVTNARTVSDAVMNGIAKRDGAAIRAKGSPEFQKTYSAATLTQEFKAVEIATLKKPTLDRQIVIDSPSGRNVYFVYKYSALKVPFYVQTDIQHKGNHWYLVNISGNIDEATLTGGH